MLKLRTIGMRDYCVLEGEQRIGRNRFAEERIPGLWTWNVIVHIPGRRPALRLCRLEREEARRASAIIWVSQIPTCSFHPPSGLENRSPSLSVRLRGDRRRA
jgi:hypothetical protein